MEKIVYFLVFFAIVGINALSNPTTNSTQAPETNVSATTVTLTPNTTTTDSKNKSTTPVTEAPVPPARTTPDTPAPMPPATYTNDNGTKATMLKFTFTDPGTRNVCIIAEMAMKFVFSYNMTEGAPNKTKMEGIEWNLRNGTTVSNKSNCGNITQQLVLSIPVANDTWELTLHFNKSAKGDKYELDGTSLMFVVDHNAFPNVIDPNNKTTENTHSSNVVFTWNSNTCLKCTSDEVINNFNMTRRASLHNIDTSSVKLQPFGKTNSTSFLDNLTYCPADTRVSNIVPIAVGAALAGLVLIVLIAYLIGRSRNNRGYESV